MTVWSGTLAAVYSGAVRNHLSLAFFSHCWAWLKVSAIHVLSLSAFFFVNNCTTYCRILNRLIQCTVAWRLCAFPVLRAFRRRRKDNEDGRDQNREKSSCLLCDSLAPSPFMFKWHFFPSLPLEPSAERQSFPNPRKEQIMLIQDTKLKTEFQIIQLQGIIT